MNGNTEMTLLTMPVVALVCILFSLLIFRTISAVANRIIGQPSSTSAGFSRVGTFGLIVVALLLLAAFRVRAVRSISSQSVLAQASEPPLHTISQLSEARQVVQSALQDSSGQIPVDVPATSLQPGETPVPVEADASVVVAQDTPDAVAPLPADIPMPAAAELPKPAEIPAVTPDVITPAAESPAAAEQAGVNSSGNDQAAVAATDVTSESTEDRQKRLSELASHIGPWIRSLLDEDAKSELTTTGEPAEAVESSDKQVVIFKIPGQTYALIPLNPGVAAAISRMKPLLISGGLEAMANSLARSLKEEVASQPAAALPPESEGRISDASIATLPEEMPSWIRSPDGGRFVAQTEPLLPGEDITKPKVAAINKAFNAHMMTVAESLSPALHNQSRRITLELDTQTAESCVVESYQRRDFIDSVEGRKEFIVGYSLVAFPEAVERAALQQLNHNVQADRITGLGMITGFAWLSVCFLGVGIRLWSRQSFLRRATAVPIFGLIAVPLMLLAAVIGISQAKGVPLKHPWVEENKTVSLHVEMPV